MSEGWEPAASLTRTCKTPSREDVSDRGKPHWSPARPIPLTPRVLEFRRCRLSSMLLAAILLATTACAATKGSPKSSVGWFEETSASSGIDYRQFRPYECFDPTPCGPLYMSGGAAAGDVDNDGLVDLVVTRVNDYPVLYRNLGAGKFADTTAESGLQIEEARRGNGVALADLDNDGCQDLIMTVVYSSRNLLFMGDCKGHFTEEGVERGLGEPRPQPSVYGYGIAVGDYDRDGWLDLFLGEWRFDLTFPGAPNEARLLKNKGNGGPGFFEDMTQASLRLEKLPGLLRGSFWWSPVFADLDSDGCQDLLLVGDFKSSKLFWNDCRGGFTEAGPRSGFGTEENGMGVAVGDIDHDGLLDIFVSSIYQTSQCEVAHNEEEICAHWGISGNRLYKNRGDRTFDDITDLGGVRNGRWGWGASFLDFDNDGHLDIVQTAGQFYPYPDFRADNFFDDPTFFWVGRGDGTFEDASDKSGVSSTRRGKGLLVFDPNGDGLPDIFIVQNSDKPRLYANRLSEMRSNAGAERKPGNWLGVRLVGSGPANGGSNRDGIGAQVRVRVGMLASPLVAEKIGGSAFLGQNEPTLHFGIGEATQAEVEVYWPKSDCRQRVVAAEVNKILTIEEADCLAKS
jgi:hypothetical protein